MIHGMVESDEGRIRLTVQGPTGEGQEVGIEAVIDTGYTASLTLPSEVIISLDLRWQSLDRGILADGSECLFDVYEAWVEWDGHLLRILIEEADTDPLVGMGLLNGYELTIQVCSGGRLKIERIESN